MAAPGFLSLAPEIDDFRRQFEELSAEGDALTGPLRDDQFVWRPSPASWSIALCLEHLNVTARLYLPQLDEGIASAIRRGVYGEGPFTYNWMGRLLPRMVEPPPRFRVKTPRAFQPPADRARREIVAAFRAYQVQFVDRLRQANGLDLARARVTSPISPWVRLSLGGAFALVAAHERRHLWQARQVMTRPDFPR